MYSIQPHDSTIQHRWGEREIIRLGPRAVGELLAEIGAERSVMTVIDQKLDTYANLEPETLEVTGGDRFWPAPVYEVQPSPEPPGRSGNRAITRDSTA